MIELEEVRAKIETADKSTIFLSAKDGLYNRKTSILNLNHNVIVRSSSGFEMHLDEAIIDTGSGEVVSNKPVEVRSRRTPRSTPIGLRSKSRGEIVRFIGSVVMNLDARQAANLPAAQPRRRNDERERDQAASMRRCWPADSCAAPYARPDAGAMPARPPRPERTAPERAAGLSAESRPAGADRGRALEVRDKEKIATFSGNVKVVQGDTTMRCKSLVVFYEQDDQGGQPAQPRRAMPAATPGPGGSSQISRLEAKRRRHRHPEGPDRHRRHAACST